MLAIAAIAGGSGLRAGDAIVFGTEKPRAAKVEPGKESAPVQKAFRLEKLANPAPFESGMTPSVLPPITSNSKKDKRQQNAEDEKKNWLLLDDRELQDKDEEKNFLGVRDDDFDGLDNGKDNHDYTFRVKQSDSSKVPGRLQAPGQSPSHLTGPRRDSEAKKAASARQTQNRDTDTKREPRSSAIVFGTRDNPPGAAGGGGVDLKGMFDPRGSDRNMAKSEFSLRDFLDTGGAQPSREQQARAESFKHILGNSPSSGGLSDPVNFRSDFTRQPLTPVLPSSPVESAPKSGWGDSFAPRQSFGQPNSTWNSLASPDPNSRPSAFGPAPASPGAWRPTPVEWPKSKF